MAGRRGGPARLRRLLAGLCLAPGACLAAGDLEQMSLEQLSSLEVTSVSKSGEPLRQAPAAIYVITHDDLIRAGVTTIAQALRLAPNLQVTQLGNSNFMAGARGFAGAEEAQNFANKLLVLIDGRSVYSPLYSGVYLEVQDLAMEDIDRIEVISGPGATLWGANAMNGVINIITRPAWLSDHPQLTAQAGDRWQGLDGRWAGRLDDSLAYRVYGKAFRQQAQAQADGASAFDAWSKLQGGFRADWSGAADTVTAQGDLYHGDESQPGQAVNGEVEGGNLLARWQHRSGRGLWQLQGYYDYSERDSPPGGNSLAQRSYDVELQESLDLRGNRIVWGAGSRLHRYHITNSANLIFEPDSRTLTLGDLFAQDTLALGWNLELTLGLKLEQDPYAGWTPLPDLRLAWHAPGGALLWAAAARAIRAPTPFDEDVQEKLGGALFLTGNRDFKPEQVDAYELGYRGQPLPSLSLSAALFFNRYDDLRSIEPGASGGLPLQWGNEIRGHAYGLDAWAQWQALDWWRLSPGLRLLRKELQFMPGSSQILGVQQSGDDPRSQALLRSAMDFGARLSFDTTLRYTGTLPDPHLPAWAEMDASLLGHVSRHLDLSLSGFNLLHGRHLEYPAPSGEYIRRSVLLQARWTF
jgi:iron complex outermembrane receptor protein